MHVKWEFFSSNFYDFFGTESFFLPGSRSLGIVFVWIRIGNKFVQILDPDPYQNNTDPQHWVSVPHIIFTFKMCMPIANSNIFLEIWLSRSSQVRILNSKYWSSAWRTPKGLMNQQLSTLVRLDFNFRVHTVVLISTNLAKTLQTTCCFSFFCQLAFQTHQPCTLRTS